MIWEIDPYHTLVEFSVKHLGINFVKGRFNEVQGTIYLDTRQPENSWVKADVQVNSLTTGVAQRDEHLRSADFFDAQRYPSITFESDHVRRTGAESGIVTGSLALHGVTRTTSFQTDFTGYARDPVTNKWRAGFTAIGVIDRRMFHMHFNPIAEVGISLLDFETRIEIRIEALRVE
jgi:polyisoprenoid-binding protein YceI